MIKQSTLINFIDDTQLRLEGHLGGSDQNSNGLWSVLEIGQKLTK